MIKYANLKKLSKTIACTTLATGLFAGTFTGYTQLLNRSNAIYAQTQSSYTWEDVSSDVCSNYNFASSGSDKIWSPTNFTAVDPTNIGSNSDILKAGVIDCTAQSIDDYQKTYGLSEQDINHTIIATSSEDTGITHHLMINGMNNDTKYAFKTPDFTLEANSYYEISVLAKVTSNNGGFGTIVLDGLSNTHQSNSIRITNQSWDTYSFYVSTGANLKENVNLQLWLGSATETSTDAVFYNKITMKRYSQSAFVGEPNKDIPGKTISIDLEKYDEIALFDNQDFSTSLTNSWSPVIFENNATTNTLCDVYTLHGDYHETLKDLNINNPFTNGALGNSSALLMYNEESTCQGIESVPFAIERDNVYRLSVWAKSDCGATNGATIQLVENGEIVGTQTVSTSITSNASFNDWTEYNFYIKGNPFRNSMLQIRLLLGTEETPTNGYVWFDQISMQKVTYTEYQSPLGTNIQVNLDKSATNTILNGDFTSVNNETTSNVGALTPANWTLSAKDEDFKLEDSISGVIPTRSDLFQASLEQLKTNSHYTPLTNPGLTPDETVSTIHDTKNKVLLLGNGNQKITQTYTSDEFTLEGNKFYRISFLVQTQNVAPSATSGVTLKLKTSDKTIYEYSGIASEGSWDSYAVYLATNTDTSTCTIELTLDNSTGYALFDKVLLQTFEDETSSSLDYDTSNIGHKYKTVETKNTFDNYVQNDYVTDEYYEPFDWDFTVENNNQSANIKAGVTKYNHENVLSISSATDIYATYAYSKPYNFTTGSYYKLSITLKTDQMGQLDGLQEEDEEGNIYPYGVYITLGNIGTFKGINTKDERGNGYKTYTFYIAPNATTTSTLSISLGSEHALTYGNVYVQNVSLETLESSSAFESATAGLDSMYNIVVNDIQNTENDNQTPADKNDGGSDLRLDFVIPSVLLALAILIAIIGTLLRRIKVHKKPKVKTPYDRRKTLEVQMNKQERIDLRNSVIEDLNEQISEIDEETSQMMRDFDTQIAESKEIYNDLIESYKAQQDALKEEHKKVVSEYKEKIKDLESDEQKAKAEKQFAKLVRHLQDREEAIAKKLEMKDEKTITIEQKRDQQRNKQLERRQVIQKEIEEIKLEIEQINNEGQEMWSSYQKEKEVERQDKLLTKVEKTKAKSSSKGKTSSTKKDDNETNDQNDDVSNPS